jgi:uncharacterized membrane protein YbhN (UPF0104 family)
VEILLYTVAVWMCEAVAMYINLRAFQLPLGLAAAAFLVAATGLSFALPLTPGNVGVYQGVCVLVLGALGVERDRAFAFGIGVQAFSLTAVVLCGLVLLQREGLQLRRLAAEKAASVTPPPSSA